MYSINHCSGVQPFYGVMMDNQKIIFSLDCPEI